MRIFFSLNNKKYDKYIQIFNKEFEDENLTNLNYDKINQKGKLISINHSYSTQQGSSHKKNLSKK